jgi:uncharacterized protein YeaO (DUF488 family)
VIKIKRIYDAPAPADGYRVLVDRLWPRGLGKEKAHVDEWLRGIAPTGALRAWFAHDPEKWEKFRARYRSELEELGKRQELEKLKSRANRETVTLLFGARDRERNNAVVLKEILEELS